MAAQRINITVNLEVKELMYDIMNKSYLTGRSKIAVDGAAYEAGSNMQASEDEEDSQQIRRSIATHFTSLKSLLGEYLSEETQVTDNKINKEIQEDGRLTLGFSMPSNFHKASCDSIGKSLHSYIVNQSVADWFLITSPADAESYRQHAVWSLENAKRSLYKRSRPSMPTYS